MFQYAFALALERRYGGVKLDLEWIRHEDAHNGYELDRHFRVRLPVCSDEERRAIGDIEPGSMGRARRKLGLTKKSQYTARSNGWDPRAMARKDDTYFSGYWQSYKYYLGIEGHIREALEFVEPLSQANRAILEQGRGRTLIGVHVRRGDFLSSRAFSEVCDRDYYRAALAATSAEARDPLYLVFSDDLDWCRDNLAFAGEALFVDWNRNEESYADMRLMVACDAVVIANSSFSWWGAWLGEREGRTVAAPSRWYGGRKRDNPDKVPPEWIRMPKA